jgi:periplasmic divalent cation tolerance protein
MDFRLIYTTCGSMQEARDIGGRLVKDRLAACVNIFEKMNSIYMWKGKLQDDNEVVMIAKTTEERVEAVMEKIRAVHSYECPCILSLPISDGNPLFLAWIAEQVRAS